MVAALAWPRCWHGRSDGAGEVVAAAAEAATVLAHLRRRCWCDRGGGDGACAAVAVARGGAAMAAVTALVQLRPR